MQEAYFQNLNQALKQQGNGMPQLVMDVQRFEANFDWLKQHWPKGLKPRLAVKSLACAELLHRAAQGLDTQAFMLFHMPHLQEMFALFPAADILFGKPMPIQALKSLDAAALQYVPKVQWLIDSTARLEQYLAFAQQHQLQLRINLEIDIGMRRGGFAEADPFKAALAFIRLHPQQFKLSGLMGYDAHVQKMPKPFFCADKIYQQSQQRYQQFIQAVADVLPEMDLYELTLNGAGSPTLLAHLDETVCNDLTLGSMLLKPHDFAIDSLADQQSALWIAAPVLKVIEQVQLPELDWLAPLMQQKAVFIYGGYWRGVCVYPAGAKPHALYGRSSNQEMLQLPKHSRIAADDYIFIQPSQSESIIPQFAQLWLYDKGQLRAYPTFRE